MNDDVKKILDKFKEYKTPLQYDNFKDYYVEHPNARWKAGKQQWIFKFENGYGASVIKHYGSYGYEDDLFELAVITFNGDNWGINYETSITDDVIGYLTNNDVLRYLIKIQRLDENGR